MFKAADGTEILAHKIRLRPNCKQKQRLAQAAGVARFAYNWGLAEWERQYQLSLVDPEAPRPDWMKINKQLNAVKREQFPWMLDVTKCAPERALMELGRGYQSYFAKRTKRPHFHKKGERDSFYLHRNSFKIKNQKIWIPKLGWVRLYEPLRFNGRITSATVSRQADLWFVSVAVEMPKPKIAPRPYAAINLEQLAAGSAVSACGEAGAGRNRVAAKPASAKQEVSGHRDQDSLNSRVQVIS